MMKPYSTSPPQTEATRRQGWCDCARRFGRNPRRLLLAVLGAGMAVTATCAASGCHGTSSDDAVAARRGTEHVAARHAVPEPPAASPVVPMAAVADGSDSTSTAAEPVWQTNYKEALALAAERNRPVLLRFTAEWCVPCQVMDRSVFADRQVQAALAEHVIPLKLDIDEERSADVARRFGVRGIPTLLLVDAGGEELARGGFMSAEALEEFLRRS